MKSIDSSSGNSLTSFLHWIKRVVSAKISDRLFYILLFAILTAAFVIRIIPPIGNNFYFTMDQGNDAVHVREILNRHQILLRGPETGIDGVYHGALWYYFIAIGYLVFGGHPFGSVFMLILLNVSTLAFLTLTLSRQVSRLAGLAVGFFLLFSWSYYDTSRFGFNPFPLVALSIALVVFLSLFSKEKQKYFLCAAIPVGLGFHCETAAAVTFLALWTFFGAWAFFTKRLHLKIAILSALIVLSFFIPRIISEIQTNFSQSKALQKEFRNPRGVFIGTNFTFVSNTFKGILARRIIPQDERLGVFVFIITLILFLRTPRKNRFTLRFVLLALLLIFISWVWFGTNKGWRSWHTVYIRPLLFISLVLMCFQIRRKLGIVIFFIVLISQIYFFQGRYRQNFRPTDDQSILANELSAIDWTYQKSDGYGFYAYSYLPSVYDYPYQYLYWWRGTKKYGYVPCEYSTYLGTPSIFVPGESHYQTPKRECGRFRFLIVEPDEHAGLRDKWLEQVRRKSSLVEEMKFGNIVVEKRVIE